MAKGLSAWTDDELEAAARLTPADPDPDPEPVEPDRGAIALEEIRALRQEQKELLGQVAGAVTQLGVVVAAIQSASIRLAASSERAIAVSVGAPQGLEECVAALRDCAKVIAALVAKEPPAPPVTPPTPPAEHPIQVNIAAAEPPPALPPPSRPWGELITVLERDAEGRTRVAEKKILYEAPDGR